MLDILVLVAQLCTRFDCKVDDTSAIKSITVCANDSTGTKTIVKFTDPNGDVVLVLNRGSCLKT